MEEWMNSRCSASLGRVYIRVGVVGGWSSGWSSGWSGAVIGGWNGVVGIGVGGGSGVGVGGSVAAVVRAKQKAALEAEGFFANDGVDEEEGDQAEEEKDYDEYVGDATGVEYANLIPGADRIWGVQLILCVVGLLEVVCGVVFVGEKGARRWGSRRGVVAVAGRIF